MTHQRLVLAEFAVAASGVNSVISAVMKSVKCGRWGWRATRVFCHGVRFS